MDFEDFEGFKKISNEKDLKIEEIYDILKKFQDATGEVKYFSNNDDLKIVVDVDGKYYVDVYLKNKDIIIERKLESGYEETDDNGKSVSLSHADRVIEQIYDLLKEYLEKGTLTEEITKAKKILRAKQKPREFLNGAVKYGTTFEVTDEKFEEVYEIKENPLLKTFSVFNVKTQREEATINYSNIKENKFTILKHPFENIILEKDSKSEKTRFTSQFSTKNLKISGDYTDSHYLIELNEIVIGAIDNLDYDSKTDYRIEINDLDYEYIIIAFVAIADVYADYMNNKIER